VRWGIVFYILFITSSRFSCNEMKGFNVFIGSKADVLVFKFYVTVRFLPHAIPNFRHQNCIPTAAIVTDKIPLLFCYINVRTKIQVQHHNC